MRFFPILLYNVFSYIASEVIWGAKFKIMYHADAEKGRTILDLNKLNEYEKIELLSRLLRNDLSCPDLNKRISVYIVRK
jgi:hypothetical protein